MGFLRKAIIISTGGVAPIKANSKKERTAKAAEKQLRIQRQMLRQQQAAAAAVRPASPPRPVQPPAISQEIERLHDQHARGLLTDAELAAAKAKVLGR